MHYKAPKRKYHKHSFFLPSEDRWQGIFKSQSHEALGLTVQLNTLELTFNLGYGVGRVRVCLSLLLGDRTDNQKARFGFCFMFLPSFQCLFHNISVDCVLKILSPQPLVGMRLALYIVKIYES